MEMRSVEAGLRCAKDAQVKYLIVGGLAVHAYGYERLARYVDMVMELDPGNIIRGLRALPDIGYRALIPVTPKEFADAGQRESWRREKNMIMLKLWSDEYRRRPVDVFVYEPFNFASEYRRAKWHSLAANIQVSVISYEALLSMKRAARRPRDSFVPSGRGIIEWD